MVFPVMAFVGGFRPDDPICSDNNLFSVYPKVLADNANGEIFCSLKSGDSFIGSMKTPEVEGDDANKSQYKDTYHQMLSTSGLQFCPEPSVDPCGQVPPSYGADSYLTTAVKVPVSDIHCAAGDEIAIAGLYISPSFYIADAPDATNQVSLRIRTYISLDSPDVPIPQLIQVSDYNSVYYGYGDRVVSFNDVGSLAQTDAYRGEDFWVYFQIHALTSGTAGYKGMQLKNIVVDLKFQ